jgi:hypothetical protein
MELIGFLLSPNHMYRWPASRAIPMGAKPTHVSVLAKGANSHLMTAKAAHARFMRR